MKRIWWFGFLCLIPTQLGRHFWPEWSNVLGMRVDYLSPTLYLIDLVWIGVVINSFDNWKKIRPQKWWWWVVLIVGLNIFLAQNWQVASLRWLRWGQWGFTIFLIKENLELVKKYLTQVVAGWILVESGLALAQVMNGGSLQGIFYWLGERSFSLTTIGIAQVSVGGEAWLRAYGTFSHPNSLAGFLWLSLMIWERGFGKLKWIASEIWVLGRKIDLNKVVWWLVWWWGIVGIVLAGSRTVWVLLAVFWIYKGGKMWSGYKKRIGMILVMLGFFVLVWSVMAINYQISDYLGGWDKASGGKRWDLMKISGLMIKDNWLVGVGAGNFLVKLPEYLQKNGIVWLQPVHNIGLLALSELGILGVVMMSLLIIKNRLIRLGNKKWWWLAILVTGMVDHYWLTLPQNSWLLALIMII